MEGNRQEQMDSLEQGQLDWKEERRAMINAPAAATDSNAEAFSTEVTRLMIVLRKHFACPSESKMATKLNHQIEFCFKHCPRLHDSNLCSHPPCPAALLSFQDLHPSIRCKFFPVHGINSFFQKLGHRFHQQLKLVCGTLASRLVETWKQFTNGFVHFSQHINI